MFGDGGDGPITLSGTIFDVKTSTLTLALALTPLAFSQIAKVEFEAASIRVNPPRTGFRFTTDQGTGGPGSSNPGMFRCSSCTLATLIAKALDLQGYQFPGKASLGDNTFEVMARIPAGATPDDFREMLGNLLKDRFGLEFHFKEKTVRGYHLVVSKSGPKLKESMGEVPSPAPEAGGQHGAGQGQNHAHTGLVAFGGTASFRGDHQTIDALVRILADQLSVPVDDRTGLAGKYDIALNWSGTGVNNGAHGAGGGGGDHGPGGWNGDHGGGGGGAAAGGAARPVDGSGPTLFDALQSQLGLRLVPSEQTVARILVVDHVEPLPTSN